MEPLRWAVAASNRQAERIGFDGERETGGASGIGNQAIAAGVLREQSGGERA
jgi:hypothetical protein